MVLLEKFVVIGDAKMQSSSIQTTEFLIPGGVPSEWFDTLTTVWNQSLFYLFWLQHWKRGNKAQSFELSPEIYEAVESEFWGIRLGYDLIPPVEVKIRKQGDDWVHCCDIARTVRLDRTKSWDSSNTEERACCPIYCPRSVVPAHAQPVGQKQFWMETPPISNYSAIDLRKPFAAKRCDWIKEATIPSVYINDFISLVVMPAWESYQKGKRGKPRFKGKSNPVTTIACESFRAQCHSKGDDRLKLPGAIAHVPGLERRLLTPIARLIKQMKANPSQFPALEKKVEKLRTEALRKVAKAENLVIKDLSAEALAALKQRINEDEIKNKAIEYFEKPGSFRILRRDGAAYLQITAEMPVKVTPTSKIVVVDTGINYLVVGSNGMVVKHPNFSKEEVRLKSLQRVLAEKKPGSLNFERNRAKLKKVEGRIRRSKRKRQTYVAAWLADVNREIRVKLLKIPEAIATPNPIPDKEGERYIPNGAGDAAIVNRLTLDAALGQFVNLVEQQAAKKNRTFTKIDIEPEANVEDMEQQIQTAETTTESNGQAIAREPDRKKKPKSTGTPGTTAVAKKRNRKREEAIG